jgi:hypothetical protein
MYYKRTYKMRIDYRYICLVLKQKTKIIVDSNGIIYSYLMNIVEWDILIPFYKIYRIHEYFIDSIYHF